MPFPPAWNWLVDEAIPAWVKKHYSPQESWKNKPFSKEDARFFFKGIEELSELFTEDRSKMTNYFAHPRFRSGYLLYFLPLQAAKFLTLFSLHPQAAESILKHGKKTGTIRLVDLGSGPATASIAVVLWLLQRTLKTREELPKIEIDLIDTNAEILKDGKGFLESFGSNFPSLRGKLKINVHCELWWKSPALFERESSLVLLGHVLNEAVAPKNEKIETVWKKLFASARGAGVLIIEPASRVPSQNLSQMRDHWIESEILPAEVQSIWGPCLHAGKCPLSEGRDWCHFSVPTEIPGEWFKAFSKGFGSERQWVKFSYLWTASKEFPAPVPATDLRRVVSDALSKGPGPTNVLLCEPEQVQKYPVSGMRLLHRGDVIKRQPGWPSLEGQRVKGRSKLE